MPALNNQQVDELLGTAVVARLAVVKPDGTPYIVPVWQHWDGKSMYVISRAKSRFVEFISSEPRVAVSCADDLNPSHGRVLIEGTVEVVEGPVLMTARMLELGRAMAKRYAGAAGLEYLDSTMDKPRYLLKITPDTMTTWRGGWHPRYG